MLATMKQAQFSRYSLQRFEGKEGEVVAALLARMPNLRVSLPFKLGTATTSNSICRCQSKEKYQLRLHTVGCDSTITSLRQNEVVCAAAAGPFWCQPMDT